MHILVSSESASNGSPYPKDVIRLLEQLKQTSAGTVVYDQIISIVDDWRSTHSSTDRAYSTLLMFLLEAYARNPTAENLTRITARLARERHSPSLSLSDGRLLPRNSVEGSGETLSRDRDWPDTFEQILSGLLGNLGTEGRPREQAPRDEEEREEPDIFGTTYPPAERRVDSAYRLHLDRKREEIEKLQETLFQKTKDAIAQNKEFGALLETERSALDQASDIKEIEALKQILIEGNEELIQGQRVLAEKLHSSIDYLRLVKSDSEQLHDELNKVRLLSLTDDFTSLPNRRAFMRRLEDEIGRARRYGTPLALAIIDLDEFKSINDKYGHAAGDDLLRWYANNVLSTFRHHDMVARYGGEEFAVLLPNTDQDGALHALDKARSRVGDSECICGGINLPVPTFSTGLTMYVPGEQASSVIERADKALYRAKRLGRDRIEVEILGSKRVEEPENKTTS